MPFVLSFEHLNKNDAGIAGGKGASLGEMTEAGIPVPPGFVILANAFDRFLSETDIGVEIDATLRTVNVKEMHTIENASEKIQALILAAEMPVDITDEIEKNFQKLDTAYVAVRSSATAEDSASAAWAGQLDTYLNTTTDHLLENVQKCWASLFTPRAIFYRFEKGLHQQKISVAVVVQTMVNSEKSGVAFSVHPVTEDRNQLIMEAGFGLGEAIVSGQITPDSYVVTKSPRNIIDTNIATQTRGLYRTEKHSTEHGHNEWRDIAEPQAGAQVLTKEQIQELSEIVVRIENHYGFPCDIEWAFEKGRFYIVQSRPITTLVKKVALVFEKSITRDWGIIYAEIWHKVFTEEFIKQLGWGYTEVIFEGENNNITVYRAPEEHIDGMRDSILSHIDRDRSWLDKNAKIVQEKVQKTIAWMESVDRKGFKWYSEKELLKIFDTFTRMNVELGPLFIVMLWFPIQMEHHEKADLYQKMIDEAIKTRTQIEKIGPMVDTFARKMTEEVAMRAGIEKNLARFISSDQMIRFFEKGVCLDENILSNRREYFIVTNDGILSKNLEEYLLTCRYSLRKIDVTNIDTISGSVAYHGIVRGVAKIVRNKDTFYKFHEGEILITGMTTPEFLPLIKMSAGFVTDEGGVTCHAAIAAREMKKPCIIGTKIATQVLKDGDMVEVDAEKGIVRLL